MNMNFFHMRRQKQYQHFFVLLSILLGCAILNNGNKFVVFAFVGGQGRRSSSNRRQIQSLLSCTATHTTRTSFYNPSPSSGIFMNSKTFDASSSPLFRCSQPNFNLNRQRTTTPNVGNSGFTIGTSINNRRENFLLLKLNGSMSPDNETDKDDGENNLSALLYNLYKLTLARLWNTWFFRLLRGIKAKLFKGGKDDNDINHIVDQKERETDTKQFKPPMVDKGIDSDDNKVLIAEKYIQNAMDRVEKQEKDIRIANAAIANAAIANAAITNTVTTSDLVITKDDSVSQEEKVLVVAVEEEEEKDVAVPGPEIIAETVDEMNFQPVITDVTASLGKSDTEVLTETVAPVVANIENETASTLTSVDTAHSRDKKIEELKVEKKEVEEIPEPTTVQAAESFVKPVIDSIEQIEKDIAIVEQSSRSNIQMRGHVDEEDPALPVPEPSSESKQLTTSPQPRGNRWAISAPDVDLSATWKIVVSDEFKKEYDTYLKNLGQPSIVRSIAVSIVELTTEEITQGDKGRSLCIKGKNLRGVWERTLVASGSDYESDFDETLENHNFVDLVTADKERVKAEAWWEDNGTVHRSFLRGGKKYGGGDFESKRYLENEGNTLICESKFHPKEGTEPAVIKWTFNRAG